MDGVGARNAEVLAVRVDEVKLGFLNEELFST